MALRIVRLALVGIQAPDDVVQLGVSGGVRRRFARPPDRLGDEPLSRRFLGREGAQEREQAALGGAVAGLRREVVDFQEEEG